VLTPGPLSDPASAGACNSDTSGSCLAKYDRAVFGLASYWKKEMLNSNRYFNNNYIFFRHQNDNLLL
jgi:hypothetical protein